MYLLQNFYFEVMQIACAPAPCTSAWHRGEKKDAANASAASVMIACSRKGDLKISGS
jgi:hypothetical protein